MSDKQKQQLANDYIEEMASAKRYPIAKIKEVECLSSNTIYLARWLRCSLLSTYLKS